jgi:hypothetical protein
VRQFEKRGVGVRRIVKKGRKGEKEKRRNGEKEKMTNSVQ